ncbi:MAG: KamA family radical SAM protein [Kiritimatiellia bacterium]
MSSALKKYLKSQVKPLLWSDWEWQVRNTLSFEEVAGLAPLEFSAACAEVNQRFPVRLTPYYLDLLIKEGWSGPLSEMALPSEAELESGGFSADPFEEQGRAACGYGVKQRFEDRVLIMCSGLCAMNCRHCTRKGLLGKAELLGGDADLQRAVEFVRSRPLIREVLLSGGDPLMLADERITAMVWAFAELPQIDAVRIGTRVPVTLPYRITRTLVAGLAATGKVWVNTQFNHASEITIDAVLACKRLVEAGIPTSNQSVLLRGVNDSCNAMFELCSTLQRVRVRPYYVFLCDPVAGIEHFRVARERAIEIESELGERLGGLALPRFVEDLPGAKRKQMILIK